MQMIYKTTIYLKTVDNYFVILYHFWNDFSFDCCSGSLKVPLKNYQIIYKQGIVGTYLTIYRNLTYFAVSYSNNVQLNINFSKF